MTVQLMGVFTQACSIYVPRLFRQARVRLA